MTAYRSRGDRNIVNDSKAEALEAKGLYRRAATRWMEVMNHCAEDEARDWVRRRMDECLQKVRRPPARAEDFGGLHKAAKETQHHMGIAQPNGQAFRLKTSR
ncbi:MULTISPECIES: PerC family transcriptional regulator [Klebsiella/Raoultella group]|uniref:PerC family transcriptional regulator n=1 Tax=Klebsiella/Raoultella group TaxID=2890311 RepID=UPI0015D4ED6B|nr:PerC family transcriptional regulator [Klebsiella variicola]